MKLLKATGIFIIFHLFSCGAASPTSKKITSKRHKVSVYKESQAFKKQDNKIYFNILHLNDVSEIAPIEGGKFGGMARVETVRQELLKETSNTMIVLAGNFLNASLLGSIKIDGEEVKGKQMVQVMNAMNFDLVTFGNKEFHMSEEELQDRLNESEFDWVSANVLHNRNGKAHYFHKVDRRGKKVPVHDSYIKYFSNNSDVLKVGFVSVSQSSIKSSYVTCSDVFIEVERSYNEVKNQVDIVLGLTNLEIEQDRKIAKMFPYIPLIMGGHSYKNNLETVGKTKIAKADANAKTVYIHRFEYDPITKKLNQRSELLTIDDTIPISPRVSGVVGR